MPDPALPELAEPGTARPAAGPAPRTAARATAPRATAARATAAQATAARATFAVSHTDLFGLRQAYFYVRGARYVPPPFTERGLYGRVRHPLMAGFVVVFWAAPVMTAGHLLFAAAATGYILAGITVEERDLRQALGEAYADYLARVPALVPGLRLRASASARSRARLRARDATIRPEETG